MLRFLLRRLGQSAVVLILITMIVFAVFFVAPSDVARTLAGRQATPETIALINQRLGLDRPIWEQYVDFVASALRGDLGFDYYHGEAVTSVIARDLPATLSLAIGATVLAVLLGVSSGVVCARRPRSLADRSLTILAVCFYSMPAFVLGLLLLYLLYFQLSAVGVTWFPAGGYVPLTEDPLEWLRHLLLPWLTLGLLYAATYTRLTRASMLEVLGQDYVRTARAKGASESRLMYRHVMRGGITPVVTQIGIDLGALIGGTVLVETVFSIGGLGRESVLAIRQQNLPLIMGIVLFTAAAVLVANILVDLVYAIIDPRVRLH
jgi:peptide/nickel transport system permease protein